MPKGYFFGIEALYKIAVPKCTGRDWITCTKGCSQILKQGRDSLLPRMVCFLATTASLVSVKFHIFNKDSPTHLQPVLVYTQPFSWQGTET